MKTKNLVVRGGSELKGTLKIQGSKNSALPFLASSLLCRDITILYDCPNIRDIDCMLNIMRELGCYIARDGHTVVIDSRKLSNTEISSYYGSQMRACVILLGALLGREGSASVGIPGGCKIGKRPIDIHLQGLYELGVRMTNQGERVFCSTTCLRGTEIRLSYPSVGATENLLFASVLAKGRTILYNCAMEPEIEDLIFHLIQMGAKIQGIGTRVLTIDGVEQLHGIKCCVPYDRIVTGTYLLAVAATRGTICLQNVHTMERLESILVFLKKNGAQVEIKDEEVTVTVRQSPVQIQIETQPYPGIPTDLQSVFLVLAANAKEESLIQENIFESRFGVVKELSKMGADITVCQNKAFIKPVKKLVGTKVEATDLRGGAALVIAGLLAEGETRVCNIEYIQRGYEDIVEDFIALGAQIRYEDC